MTGAGAAAPPVSAELTGVPAAELVVDQPHRQLRLEPVLAAVEGQRVAGVGDDDRGEQAALLTAGTG